MILGNRDTRGFYENHPLITSITGHFWNHKANADKIWLIEFYAPWCQYCQQYVGEYIQTAEMLKPTDIEVDAVNCEVERDLCTRVFGVTAYPSFRLMNKGIGVHQIFPTNNRRDPDALSDWALNIAAEWTWLFTHSDLISIGQDNFQTDVIESDSFWIVAFLDGLECDACKSTKTNLLRLSAGLRGIAKVGMCNCQQQREFCSEYQIPGAPHAPQVRGWQSGQKSSKNIGELLYNPNIIDPHHAFQVIEKTVRIALAEKLQNSLSTGQAEFEAPPTPEEPPPQAQWNGPETRYRQQYQYQAIEQRTVPRITS